METRQQPPLKEPTIQPSEADINNVIQFPNKPETLEQPDQEVFSALELKLDEANTNAQGNLFVKIGTDQPDGSHVYARFFDAAHSEGKYLVEVSGQGFRILETPDDPTKGIQNAIVAQREWANTEKNLHILAMSNQDTQHFQMVPNNLFYQTATWEITKMDHV